MVIIRIKCDSCSHDITVPHNCMFLFFEQIIALGAVGVGGDNIDYI